MKKEQRLEACFMAVEPGAGLYRAIVERIALARKRGARVRAALFTLLALVCTAALVPSFQYAAEQFYASGFYDYLGLIISDRGFVLMYWKQFALLLIESLPSIALLLILPLAFALAYSLRRVVQTSRVAFTY